MTFMARQRRAWWLRWAAVHGGAAGQGGRDDHCSADGLGVCVGGRGKRRRRRRRREEEEEGDL